MRSEEMEQIIKEMKKIEAEHPKASVEYNFEKKRIDIFYPVPNDFIKFKDINLILRSQA